MKITECIKRADNFYPNAYSEEQKLTWCYDLSCKIRTCIKKVYGAIDLPYEETKPYIALPNDILFEDITEIFLDGRAIEKRDFRTYGIYPHYADLGCSDGVYVPKCNCVRIVYLIRPEPFTAGKIEFSNAVFTDNTITVNGNDVKNAVWSVGDRLTIEGCTEASENNVSAVLTDRTENSMTFPEGTFTVNPDGEDKITVYREINDITECPPPYDEMYIYFLLSKIHFFNSDLNSYAACTQQYLDLYDEYAQKHKETNPYVVRKSHNFY